MSATSRNSGFSLVEVMCAVVIMGVALVGLTHGITTALSSTKDSEVQTAVVLLAAGQLETLRAEGVLSDGTTEGDFGDDLPQYKWEETISPSEVDGLHHVEVVVKDAKSGAALYNLQTLLFDSDYPGTADSEVKIAQNKSKYPDKGKDHNPAKKRDRSQP
jgi:prepilin-type N-terminal cleavage/methylation domain-containing protein